MKLSVLPLAILFLNARAADTIPHTETPSVIVDTSREPVTPGKFQPTWDSLA